MKTTIQTAMLIASTAFASHALAGEDKAARALEDSYIHIAEIHATARAEEGPCPSMVGGYQQQIATAARSARDAFDINDMANRTDGRKFALPQVVKDALKDTLLLKEIMNMIDFERPETIAHSLNRVAMFGPSQGVLGNTKVYTFGAKGKVTFTELRWAGDGVERIEKEGSFSVEHAGYAKALIRIQLGDETREYYLSQNYDSGYVYAEWSLLPVDAPRDASPYRDGFVDFPSECDA